MTAVFTHAIDDYTDPALDRAVGDILDQTPARGITAGSRVLVKPNLLLPAPPAATMRVKMATAATFEAVAI